MITKEGPGKTAWRLCSSLMVYKFCSLYYQDVPENLIWYLDAFQDVF